MPESRTESRCPRCGELVLAAVRKLCAGCGKDVTREKRVRDDMGEYFCHGCWEERLAARGEEPGYVCNTCRRVFPSDQVYQDGEETVCHACYSQRTMDPNALLEAAASAGDDAPAVFAPSYSVRRAAPIPWGLIWVGVGLLVALVVAIVVMSRN
jgi:ribosomal protein L37E